MKVGFFRDKLVPDCIIFYCERETRNILAHDYACEDAGFDDCTVIKWIAIPGTLGFYVIIEGGNLCVH